MQLRKELIEHIEAKVGLDIETIRKKTPDELRSYFSKKHRKPLRFTTKFPFIGRGNVLRDRIVETSEIDEEINKIIGL